MRRILHIFVGVFELGAALLLGSMAWQLPTSVQVQDSFGKVGQVADRARQQAGLVRQQVHDLRRLEIQDLAERMQLQARIVTDRIRSQKWEGNAELDEALSEADDIATMLPLLTRHLDYQLEDQEQALGDLELSIQEASAAIPEYEKKAEQWMLNAKLLLFLLAGTFALHGGLKLGTSHRA